MPLRRIMKSQPSELLPARGLMYRDWDALTDCQRECVSRLGNTIQIEQEAYLSQHPEIKAMLEIFMAKMTRIMKRKSDVLKEAAEFFIRPMETLDEEVRKHLNLAPDVPYTSPDKPSFQYVDENLETDLKKINMKHFPPPPWDIPTPDIPTPETQSSSFLSIITSDTTLPTPEPIPTPEPTLSENMFVFVSNAVDKAIYAHVDDQTILYDTAYVELSKAVEEAMEIPVIEIKEDINQIFFNAFKMFELIIADKERIAAEIAWEKRMRKKMKRTLRRVNDFKGYETPPTPKSEISSHESYRKPPPRPCICHPQFHYNRYGKDRFGIYLPTESEYKGNNVTVTPVISVEDVTVDDKADTKSIVSKKSIASGKSVPDHDTKSIKSVGSAKSGRSTGTTVTNVSKKV